MAGMVFANPFRKEVDGHYADFLELIGRSELPLFGYGRFFEDLPVVKILEKLSVMLNDFAEYAWDDINVSNYAAYAVSFARNVCEVVQTVPLIALRGDLLKETLKQDDKQFVVILKVVTRTPPGEQDSYSRRFRILKNYADPIFREALHELTEMETWEAVKASGQIGT